MSTDKSQIFVDDLRRVLYLSKLLIYNLDSLKESSYAQSWLKVDINSIKNGIQAMFNTLAYRGKPETWEGVKCQLNSEELHDLSLLMDAVKDVTNVAEITEQILQLKKAA